MRRSTEAKQPGKPSVAKLPGAKAVRQQKISVDSRTPLHRKRTTKKPNIVPGSKRAEASITTYKKAFLVIADTLLAVSALCIFLYHYIDMQRDVLVANQNLVTNTVVLQTEANNLNQDLALTRIANTALIGQLRSYMSNLPASSRSTLGAHPQSVNETRRDPGTVAAPSTSSTPNELQEKIENLLGQVNTCMVTLADVSNQTNTFRGQVDELQSSVTKYKKLSELDRQLLAKYSKVYFLNENYHPVSLSTIPTKYAPSGGRQIHSKVLPFLTRLLDQSIMDGVPLEIGSAYRSFGTQEQLKASYIMKYGTTKANTFSADQGYSEHQLGTTVDFTTAAIGGCVCEKFGPTKQNEWLNAHAWEYGFILSYPKGQTYYMYEPWHWRFVGTALAKYLHDNNIHLYDMDQRDIDIYLPDIFD